MEPFDSAECECEMCNCPPSAIDEHDMCELCGDTGHLAVCDYCWNRGKQLTFGVTLKERDMEKKAAYIEILGILEKHDDIINNDHSINITSRVRDRIKLQDISEEFGISIKSDCNPEWVNLSEYIAIGLFGEEHRRTISWSDNGEQPDNERLLRISFPTGAYIFGGAYPKETFKSFFVELKSYGPKYCDTANNSLYYTSDVAKDVHKDFDDILSKHSELVSEELRKKEIADLEEKLKKLQS